MNTKIDLWECIASVLEGDSTVDKKRLVDNWLKEDPRNIQFFEKLKSTSFNVTTVQKAAEAKERIYWQTHEKISKIQLKRKLRLWQYVAAASFALLLAIGGFSFWSAQSVAPIYVESKSPAGSTSRLTLSDGTVVVLNAESYIRYPLSFSGRNRKVTLNGEAYFEVARDTRHPFIVETDQMKLNVLGTHFNIKAYEDDREVVTTLMEGSVSVEFKNEDNRSVKKVVLTPDRQVVLDKTTRKTVVTRVKSELYASWRNGECFFENERFIDIIKILGRQYGVQISILSPTLENQLYSGFFSKQEGLFHILNSFKKIRNFEYNETDAGIEIYERY